MHLVKESRRPLTKLAAVLTAFLLLFSLCAGFSYAASPAPEADKNVTFCSSVNSFLKFGERMLQDSPLFQLKDGEDVKQTVNFKDKFQTGRILVKPTKTLSKRYTKNASEALYFRGWYVLQYNTEKAAKEAYNALREQYGARNVLPDEVFKVNLPKTKADKTVKTQALTTQKDYLSWGIRNMGMDKVQEKLEARGNKTKVTVAVLDTGVNYLEPDMRARMVSPMDFITFLPFPMDFHGHGTHCAGTIIDATPFNVKIMPVKIVSASGIGTQLHTMVGLMYASQNGADVINMSIGGANLFETNLYDDLLKENYDKGMVQVVAAGNESMDVGQSYPACSQYVITVAATNKKNKVDKEYSNFGKKVDFAAPGTAVKGLSSISGLPGTAVMTGTSMAAPHISAAAALVKCVYPNYNQKQVYNVLKKYAVDIDKQGKDIYSGWGRIDLTGFANKL